MKDKLAFARSFVVAFLATASVVLSSVAITLAEALEENLNDVVKPPRL
jgi:hypothetical protein